MGVDMWDTAQTNEAGGWKPDNDGVAVDGWQADTSGGNEDGFTGDFSQENISKHADGFEGANDGGCRICSAEDHFARDCPEKPTNSGLCYNCNEPGHNKADCPNPAVEREFTGDCRSCGQQGHRAADCPSKPAEKCRVCQSEEHATTECTANRVFAEFANLGIADVSYEEAWEKIQKADREKDIDDMKKYILAYAKACPEITLPEIETAFREDGMNTYLIAKKQEVAKTHTIVNLQGQIDQNYALSIQLSAKPRRAKFAEGWPESAEENMARLAEAGFIMDRMVEVCSNCGELGHRAKACPEEKVEREKPVIMCALCSNAGHYARDCTEPRKVRGSKSCRECGSEEHVAKDCPNQECRNCLQLGHHSRDCESERVMVRIPPPSHRIHANIPFEMPQLR